MNLNIIGILDQMAKEVIKMKKIKNNLNHFKLLKGICDSSLFWLDEMENPFI